MNLPDSLGREVHRVLARIQPNKSTPKPQEHTQDQPKREEGKEREGKNQIKSF